MKQIISGNTLEFISPIEQNTTHFKKMDNKFTYHDLYIGMQARTEKVFNQEEVIAYSKTSGDINPIHYDPKYASKTIFKYPIVQGLLVTSLFGGLLGTTIPGPGTIHLGQNVRFSKPIFVGEKVLAEIELIAKRDDKQILTFKSLIYKENGEVAITGEEVVMFKGEIFN